MILKFLDLINEKVKKVDTNDKAWVDWVEENFDAICVQVETAKEMLSKIEGEEFCIIAIEKSTSEEKVK